MSMMQKLSDFFDDLVDTLSGWFSAERRAFLAGAKKVEDEIERIGPEIFYQAINAGLASIVGSKALTGNVIASAADVAIARLKLEGKVQLTAMVFAAIATALTELNAGKDA